MYVSEMPVLKDPCDAGDGVSLLIGAVATRECDLLTQRRDHYAAIAYHFLAIPVSSEVFECLFLATSRLVDKRCSRLLLKCMESFVFL